MLPAGRLREPPRHLSRADAVVITRADLVDDVSNLRSEISELNPDAAIFEARNELRSIERLNDKTNFEKGTPAFAFCGLGNPDGFFELLKRNNIDVTGRKAFRDHYAYSQTDIETLENEARAAQAAVLMTTAKDAVKLGGLKLTLPCYVVDIQLVLDDPEGFAALL